MIKTYIGEKEMCKDINQRDFNREVMNQKGIVVVDFWAKWCGPCKMLTPILEDLEEEIDNLKVVRVDIDENSDLVNMYGIQSVPTLKIFKNGSLVTTKVGFLPKDVLRNTLKQI